MITNDSLRKYAELIMADLQLKAGVLLEDDVLEPMLESLAKDIKEGVTQCDFSTRCYKEYKRQNNILEFKR